MGIITDSELRELQTNSSDNTIQKLANEVLILKQKLRETEERLSARVLKILEDLSKDDINIFASIKAEFEKNKDFDVLEFEREKSAKALIKVDFLEDVFFCAEEFLKAKENWDSVDDSIKSGYYEDLSASEIQQQYDNMIAKRERLFSLIKEEKIRNIFDR